ncbi:MULTISPECIES: nuclear transport factor 2 family protein [Dickeya]|uniref:FIG002994: Putative transcriptional regulator n=1 Tax=Dickeya aquatica TaxID=1401087 RepID=A0A375AAE6_9GAMM|nr:MULTISPECIES: nuclear transport factor 2 family protein [Dickeya]SLM63068.1 FIG002994: Putative transcriptional regulator [Dickeya aquatica]
MTTTPHALQRIIGFYRQLDICTPAQLADFYHQDVVLHDPLGEHRGLVQLCDYFNGLVKRTRYCHFDVHHILSDDQHATLLWRMDYAHPRLRRGAALTLQGCSWLEFKHERVCFQHDFYDMGALLYEQLPLLRQGIHFLKTRLAP